MEQYWESDMLVIYTNGPYFTPRPWGVPPVSMEEQWLVAMAHEIITRAMRPG
jgi:hypothetical protein